MTSKGMDYRLSVIWKSDLTDKMKRSYFKSILLSGYTTWTLTKRMEKKHDGNLTSNIEQILAAVPHKQQLYGHLPPITKIIQIRRTRHAGNCWRSRDKLVSDVLLLTSSHGRAKAGRPVRIYIQQLCADTECSLKDLTEAINDREELGFGEG